MSKRYSHGDAVQGHVFYCVIAFLFCAAMFALGVAELNGLVAMSDPVFAWGCVVCGPVGAVGTLIRAVKCWPEKRDDE